MNSRETKLRRRHISAKAEGALALYRSAWSVASAVAPLVLRARAKRGKEDPARLGERRGIASRERPTGTLIWIHGASVGESLAALPLVSALLEKPNRHVLVTTGTVTSAQLMAERLPPRAFHQYAPLDAALSVRRFLKHWRPDLALFIESELWPNLILETRAQGVPMALINARLSERSFRGWHRAKPLARRLLSSFDECLAQDDRVADRLRALGATSVRVAGSLKADAPPLPADQNAFNAFLTALGPRPIFLAASTHPGEEEQLLQIAQDLRAPHANALTIIVPRHPARGPEIEALALARGFSVKRRGTGALPEAGTEIYIADTLGELGLFYRAAKFAFLGGSLVEHGGQNPLEPARLGIAVLTGPHTHNFEEIFEALLGAQGEGRAQNVAQLRALALGLICNPVAAARLGASAKAAAERLGGALDRSVELSETLLADHARA
jgi:3-deoxy-D-manno-octulosonic-acid transferase